MRFYGWLPMLAALSAGAVELTQIAPDFSRYRCNNILALGQAGGTAQLAFANTQPMLVLPPLKLDAAASGTIEFTMKYPAGVADSGRILFTTEQDPVWSDALSVRFPIQADGGEHHYAVNMAAHQKYRGTITGLRLDPGWISRFRYLKPAEKQFTVGKGFAGPDAPYRWRYAEAGLPESFTAAACPQPYQADDWRAVALKNNLAARPASVRLVMLGDSITHNWLGTSPQWPNGKKVYDAQLAPRDAFVFALSGDKTQHTLHQLLDARILEGLKPRCITLMIGVNNLLQGDSPKQVAEGVAGILAVLKKQCPDTPIVLLSILPSNLYPDTPGKIVAANRLLQKLADGKQVLWLDLTSRFLDGKEFNAKLTYDKLHLNHDGYAVWEEAMRPTLDKLLDK